MIHDQPEHPEATAQLPSSSAPESNVEKSQDTNTTNNTPAQPNKRGRPSAYTHELGERICILMAEGKLLYEIEEMEGMPSAETIRRWSIARDDFRGMYTRAREASGDALAERAMQEAATAKCKDTAAAARVKSGVLQWMAAKRAPKQYGDKTTVEMDANITSGPGKVAEDAPDWLRERMEGRQAAAVAVAAGAAAPATKH